MGPADSSSAWSTSAVAMAGLIEAQRCRKGAKRRNLLLERGDLLLRRGDRIGARYEAERRLFLIDDGHQGASKLCGVSALLAILRLPKFELLDSALAVVRDGRLCVIRRLLCEQLRTEEARVHDSGSDAERRDLGR